MTQEEVKPSFSLKYLVLTILSTAVISGIGLLITKALESKPIREIEVLESDQTNLLNDAAFPKDQIEASYTLKESQNKKIATLFRKVVVIRNSGNEGAENIPVTANLQESNAYLISAPKIKTEPKEIVDAISISKTENGTSNRQTWNISLLNPGEAVVFEYFVYSEEKLDSINLKIIPRKKDWTIANKSLLNRGEINSSTSLLKMILTAAGAMIAFLISVLLFAVPFYIFQWNKRQDYRQKYSTFSTFYAKHKPMDLFKAPDPEVK
jgi:hypothetical protein